MNQQQAFNDAQDAHDATPEPDTSAYEADLEAAYSRIMLDAEKRQDVICEAVRWCDERNQIAEVLGKWAFESESKLTEAERDQGILDLATIILIPLAKKAILEAARRSIKYDAV